MMAIKTKTLTKYYGKFRGIVGLDLEVGEGEFFGFIGPNRAGKATTVKLLNGMLSPSEGNC